jgi:hypothetical protein
VAKIHFTKTVVSVVPVPKMCPTFFFPKADMSSRAWQLPGVCHQKDFGVACCQTTVRKVRVTTCRMFPHRKV